MLEVGALCEQEAASALQARRLKQLKWVRLAKGKACSFLLSVRFSSLCGMSQTHPDINRMVDGGPHRTGRSFWHD